MISLNCSSAEYERTDKFMDIKEQKKLSKTDLLKVICDQEKEICDLKFELEQAKAALEDKKIRLEQAGSIANAAVEVSGVLKAAQNAADVYLESIKERTLEQTRLLEENDARIKARTDEMLADARQQADKIVASAHAEAEAKWNDLTARLEEFYSVHEGLKELLSGSGVDPDKLINK